MDPEHFVIIGNGPAANQAALTLRENSQDLLITLVGQEPFPYYKPHLLPEYVSGKLSEEALYFALPAYYKQSSTKLRLGQRVVNIDFQKKQVTLAHKEIITFTGLIIACGGRQRVPENMLMLQDLALTLKTPADAKAWIDTLSKVESVLIVGGDLTSLSLTRALLSLNKRVFFMLNEDSFWPLPLDSQTAEQVKHRLSVKGVDVMNGTRIKRIAKISDRCIEVETDREMLQVGILGAFFGMIPNVRFLARSGLDIDRGILVNEHLQTRFDSVYAAGDCAQVYHPGIKDYWVSIGYENAVKLGRVAALNLLGGKYSVDAKPSSIFCSEGILVNTSWWLEF